MIPSNFSEHKIQNAGERYILTTYLLIVLLSSLIGDSIILIASVRYNAIKLNKFIVAVMQHIAISDLLRSVSYVLPAITSLAYDSWVEGQVPGYIIYFVNACSLSSGNILITFLTTSKLAIVKFPLRARRWSERIAHVICSAIWLFMISLHGLFLVFCQRTLFFSYIEYNVTVFLQTNFTTKVVNWFVVFSSIIPTFIVILATAAILCHLMKTREVSKRIGGSVRWQGIAAVSATSTVFCVSAIPLAISFFAATSRSSESKAMVDKVTLVRSSHFISPLNIMSNIYIYWFTIQSFRQFIKSRVTRLSEFVMRYFSSRATERNDDQPGPIELSPAGDQSLSFNVL